MQELHGHTSFETAYLVENYPYGRLRCKIWYWLEHHPKFGVRFCSRTENPKTGRLNNPKRGTYHLLGGAMYLDENNHVKFTALSHYSDVKEFQYFLTHFPQANRLDIKIFAKAKALMYYKALQRGKHIISINGVVNDLTPADIEEYTAAMMSWQYVSDAA